MKRLAFMIVLIPLVLAAACSAPPAAEHPWSYADLRLLLPAGNTPTASTDILAVYTRTAGTDVEIRIDLLDLSFADDYALEVDLFDNRSFAQHPLAIHIPARGLSWAVQVGVGTPSVQARVARDPWLDTVTIRLDRAFIGERYRLDVYTYTTEPPALADEALGISSDGEPPLGRAALLLAFWDSLPASTPAQALRRWDGAHTGPNGGRHGLKLLLDAAEQNHLPVALLDLKTPSTLAALNAVGGIDLVRHMNDQGLLILPDVAYGQPDGVSLGFSRRAAAGFGLPASQFAYSPFSDLQSSYLVQFIQLPDETHPGRAGQMRLFPLPAADALQATVDGPSLDVRRELLAAALSPDPSRLVVLGGDLPNSTWGSADQVSASLTWIAAHPWIRVLNDEDLLSFPLKKQASAPLAVPRLPAFPLYTASGNAAGLDSLQLESDLRAGLHAAPKNPLTDLAWQAYLSLTAPSPEARLSALRAQYLWQVRLLLAASAWAEKPSPQAVCFHYQDGSLQVECVLANDRFFATFEPEGARLTHLFYLDSAGPHQLIGQTAQFTVGLSDPTEWKPENGEASDPAVIPGAFTDDTLTWMEYTPKPAPDSLTFRSPDGGRIKTYRLTAAGLELTCQSQEPVKTRIPLAVDPQAFFFGPSHYGGSLTDGSWIWGLANGIQVEVRSDASLTAEGFDASLPFLSRPEDPNRDYPPGYELPFPLSVITLSADKDYRVEISVK